MRSHYDTPRDWSKRSSDAGAALCPLLVHALDSASSPLTQIVRSLCSLSQELKWMKPFNFDDGEPPSKAEEPEDE